MQPSQTDILEARFLQLTTKLIHCSSLCRIAALVESKTTEDERVQYVFDFSDATDALVNELSHSLDTPLAFNDILAKYSDEVLLVLYARHQLVTQYLQQVRIGGIFELPTDDCEFFQFMLIDFLGFLT